MAIDETTQPEGGDVRLAGTTETDVGVVGEPKRASGELVDSVTEAAWNDAMSQLGGLPSNPLPLWMMLATRILRAVADGERDPQRIKRFALDGLNDHDGFSALANSSEYRNTGSSALMSSCRSSALRSMRVRFRSL